jgi:hypothetical protein
VATVAVALFSPAVGSAQDTSWNRYTLDDLGGVFIRIEAGEVCQELGVTSAAFEADVSLRLIDAEVGVLTREEMLTHQAMPELRVTLDCASGMDGAAGAVAYSVALRVQQAAQMLRNTQITLPEAVTWYTTRIGVSTAAGVVEAVRATLQASIGEFAVAWTEAHAEAGSL